ncbi:MAG: sulfurtransferase [Halothiobacillus sp.]
MIFTSAAALKPLFESTKTSEICTHPKPVLIDMSSANSVALLGAHRVDFNQIVHSRGDTVGLLPSIETFNRAIAHTGITIDRPVVILDDSQGLAASRLAWTLALCGVKHCQIIDGGRDALLAEGWASTEELPEAVPTSALHFDYTRHHCSAETITEVLNDPNQPWLIIDARSEAEYLGIDQRSRHAGHIPGAIHFDWQWCFDPAKPGYLLADDLILARLAERGITPKQDHTVAVYCQSHRRSSLMFCVLKHLGFEDVRGYPGAWSDWGNRADLPIAR